MVFRKKVVNADPGDADHFGGNDGDFYDDYYDNIDVGVTAKINTRTYYRSGKFELRNVADDQSLTFTLPTLTTAGIEIIYPNLTADDEPLFKTFAATIENKTLAANCVVDVGALPASVVLDTESNVITDAMIVAHTTSKITTSSKSLLNSAIVYTDQANVMGDFNLELHDDKFFIWNPTRSFKSQFVSPAYTADQIFNLPNVTSGTHTLLARNSIDTLLNKTIRTDDNTINHSTTNNAGDLLKNNGTKFDRFARGTSLQILRVNSGATDLEYFTLAAGDLPNHATRHQAGGADPIKLDDLATPDDNTDLNASNTRHGLLLKLIDDTEQFLRSDGVWATPPGGGVGGGDNITVNGVSVVDADFDDATPAAPSNAVNMKFQKDALTPANISAYLDVNAVSNFIMADMPGFTIKAKPTTGSGDPTDLVVGTNTVVGRVAGDIVAAALVTAQIGDDQVTFDKTQNIATSRILGRVTAAAGNIEELTGTQATALLDVFTSGLKGLVPASGGGTTNFLRADGTFAAPPGGGAPTGAQYVALATDATLTAERVLTAGDGMKQTDAGANGAITYEPDFIDLARKRISFVEECFGDFTANLNTGIFDLSGSGTGAQVQPSTNSENDHYGLWTFDTGTTATGRATIVAGSLNSFTIGRGPLTVEFLVKFPTLSTSTQEYSFRMGLVDVLSGLPTDGVSFYYNRSVDGNFWGFNTVNGGISTATVSNTAIAADTWYRCKLIVNAAGTSVSFFVNGTELNISPITTNLPSSTQFLTFGGHILKSVGTTSRTAVLDYYAADYDLTSIR